MSTKYAGLPAGYVPRIHRAEVLGARRLGPGMIRVRFGGEDLADYPTTGVGDEYVRVFFAEASEAEPRMPRIADRGWDFPEGVEPAPMRTYTVRAHRPGEIDIDFVVHAGGVAAAWALQASPGQVVAVNPPCPLYEAPPGIARQILAADEPGLPAALRIAELTAGRIATTVVAEIREPGNRLTAEVPAGVHIDYVWVEGTGNGRTPSQLLSVLRRLAPGEDTYVWLASETRVIREVRKHLRHERKLPGEAYKCVGYWIERAEEWRARWEALAPEFRAHIEELYESDRPVEDVIDEVNALYESVGL
ncbi:siderophore-interacting protein [Brevibacterium salitolerans]|uniref:Siderophore-interacting protein n=1 Tax=Brevibacterium salitolerans TaxID=1403566 RepID=A0ABN2X171_9MICO